MAEAAAVPLAIAGSQAGWALFLKLRSSRPKDRLQMWDDKINVAMEQVQKQAERSRVSRSDMQFLMQEHNMWKEMTEEFRDPDNKPNKKLSALKWGAWFCREDIWQAAKRLEGLAKKTTAGAVICHLICEAYHGEDKANTCHICVRQETVSASTPASNSGLQREPIPNVPKSTIRDTTHPTVHFNVQVNSGLQPDGGYAVPTINLVVMPTVRMDAAPSPSHNGTGTLPVISPEQTSLAAGTTFNIIVSGEGSPTTP